MKSPVLFVFLIFFPFLNLYSQNNHIKAPSFTIDGPSTKDKIVLPGQGNLLDAAFCNRTFNGSHSFDSLLMTEFKKCNLKISSTDTNLTVVEFRCSVSSGQHLAEWISHGSRIQGEQLAWILSFSNSIIYIEEIKARNQSGVQFSLHPIKLKIK